jgi:hypothetical protein
VIFGLPLRAEVAVVAAPALQRSVNVLDTQDEILRAEFFRLLQLVSTRSPAQRHAWIAAATRELLEVSASPAVDRVLAAMQSVANVLSVSHVVAASEQDSQGGSAFFARYGADTVVELLTLVVLFRSCVQSDYASVEQLLKYTSTFRPGKVLRVVSSSMSRFFADPFGLYVAGIAVAVAAFFLGRGSLSIIERMVRPPRPPRIPTPPLEWVPMTFTPVATHSFHSSSSVSSSSGSAPSVSATESSSGSGDSKPH